INRERNVLRNSVQETDCLKKQAYVALAVVIKRRGAVPCTQTNGSTSLAAGWRFGHDGELVPIEARVPLVPQAENERRNGQHENQTHVLTPAASEMSRSLRGHFHVVPSVSGCGVVLRHIQAVPAGRLDEITAIREGDFCDGGIRHFLELLFRDQIEYIV